MALIAGLIFAGLGTVNGISGGVASCNAQNKIDANTTKLKQQLAQYIAESQKAFDDYKALDEAYEFKTNEIMLEMGDTAVELKNAQTAFRGSYKALEYTVIFVIIIVFFALLLKRMNLLTLRPLEGS
jgi:hypothetical protein